MDDKQVVQARWAKSVSEPYVPSAIKSGVTLSDQERIAQAVEYIAAQLGAINAKLDRLFPEAPRL